MSSSNNIISTSLISSAVFSNFFNPTVSVKNNKEPTNISVNDPIRSFTHHKINRTYEFKGFFNANPENLLIFKTCNEDDWLRWHYLSYTYNDLNFDSSGITSG